MKTHTQSKEKEGTEAVNVHGHEEEKRRKQVKEIDIHTDIEYMHTQRNIQEKLFVNEKIKRQKAKEKEKEHAPHFSVYILGIK